jgi:cold shock protein
MTTARRNPMPACSGGSPTDRTFDLRTADGARPFNATKGYGFIQPDAGGKDVFVHISAVERAGLQTLQEDQAVEYELVDNRGKTAAENLKVTR